MVLSMVTATTAIMVMMTVVVAMMGVVMLMGRCYRRSVSASMDPMALLIQVVLLMRAVLKIESVAGDAPGSIAGEFELLSDFTGPACLGLAYT